jgi:hypothetical protein
MDLLSGTWVLRGFELEQVQQHPSQELMLRPQHMLFRLLSRTLSILLHGEDKSVTELSNEIHHSRLNRTEA